LNYAGEKDLSSDTQIRVIAWSTEPEICMKCYMKALEQIVSSTTAVQHTWVLQGKNFPLKILIFDVINQINLYATATIIMQSRI